LAFPEVALVVLLPVEFGVVLVAVLLGEVLDELEEVFPLLGDEVEAEGVPGPDGVLVVVLPLGLVVVVVPVLLVVGTHGTEPFGVVALVLPGIGVAVCAGGVAVCGVGDAVCPDGVAVWGVGEAVGGVGVAVCGVGVAVCGAGVAVCGVGDAVWPDGVAVCGAGVAVCRFEVMLFALTDATTQNSNIKQKNRLILVFIEASECL
jgi:hypothetical protein